MKNEQNIYAEQVKQVVSQEPIGIIATVVNSLILVAVLWLAIPHKTLTIWLAAMGLLSLVRSIRYHRAKRTPITADNANEKAFRLRVGMVLAGLGWGSAALFLFPNYSVAHQVFIAFVLAGMVAGAVGAFSALKYTFLCFSIPTLTPLIVRFLLVGDYICIAMGAMTLLFAVLTFATSYRIHRHIHTTLKLRFENRALVEDLETTRDRVETTNVKLREEIDDRKQAEHDLQLAYDDLKNTQDQLVQSSKLASIGELASGVAHELNQPLTVLRTAVQILQRGLDKGNLEPDALSGHLEPMERQTKRMMNIIGHLRTFSRKSQAEFSSFEINEVIENAFHMIGEQLRLHDIEVKLDLSEDLPPVTGDKNQIEQVVLNLLTNARDAIETKTLSADSPTSPTGVLEIITRQTSNANAGVEVLVKDTGNGIPRENADHLFTPFFTTKPEGKGTGLGLSISMGIIKDHQGDIEIAETDPNGTTFRVWLPDSFDASHEV